jgi:hypothetical protein
MVRLSQSRVRIVLTRIISVMGDSKHPSLRFLRVDKSIIDHLYSVEFIWTPALRVKMLTATSPTPFEHLVHSLAYWLVRNLPPCLVASHDKSGARNRRRISFNKTTKPTYFTSSICYPVQNPRCGSPVKELMRSHFSSMEAIFARPSLWAEPLTARTHLNCSMERPIEGPMQAWNLFVRCYVRDERHLHRGERGT